MTVVSWSNSQVVDQLDSGSRWVGSIITYAFPATSAGTYGDSGEALGFQAADAATQSMVRIALQAWDDLIPPSFQATTATTSEIELAFTSVGVDFALGYFPDAGTVWLNSSFNAGVNDLSGAPIGSYGFQTYLHELGHALGLDHMGNYDGSGAWVPSSYQDSTVYSVMSYFGPTGPMRSSQVAQADWVNAAQQEVAPQTPMLNDVLAIQSMYGVSTTTRTDNTTYGFHSTVTGPMAVLYDFSVNRSPVLTLFDSGGNDTLDLSGWSTPSSIDLAPGSYSSGNAMTNNIAIAWSATIENAVGGAGADKLQGNSADNRLAGGPGNDQLAGGSGNDTLAGDAGNDYLDGGAGTDTAQFPGSYASYTVSVNAVTGAISVSGGDSGTDTVTGVEFFQFADQTRALAQLLSSDTTPPLLSASSPADNATGVQVAAPIVLTFSEAVQPGSGNIVLYGAGGAVFASIAVTDTARVTFQGATVTIDPPSDLAAATRYDLQMAAGVIKDLAGNAFAGISSATAFNFSTAASSAVDDYPFALDTPGVVQTNGVATGGVVNVADDVDLFKVALVAGQTYDFDLRSAGLADPYLALYGTTGLLLLEDDDGGAAGNDARITYTAASTGTYYLAAMDYGTGTGAYTLTAQIAQDDYPWSADTAGVVTLGGTASLGRIDYVDDLDLLRVTLKAGQHYVFELDSLGLPDPFLTLFDASLVLLDQDDDSGPGLDSRLEFLAPATGTYYLGVWDTGAGTGDYSLKAILDTDDYPWSTATSGLVTVGAAATAGAIDYVGDLDLLKVNLTAGVSYAFEADRSTGGLDDPYLRLYGDSLVLLAYDDDSAGDRNARITYTATRSGAFYIGVSDYDSGTGGYTVRATALDVSAPQLVSTTPADNAVGVAVGSVLTLNFSEAVQAGSGSIVIHNGNGTVARTIAVGDGTQVHFSGSAVTVDPATDLAYGSSYYLSVDAGAVTDLAGNAFAGISSATAFNFTTAAPLTDDYPLDTGTSGVLTVGGSVVAGVIDYVDDGDMFKVSLSAGTSYRFDLMRTEVGGLDDPYLQLFGPSLALIAVDDDSGDDRNARLFYTPTVSGTYYLAAWDYATGTGRYTLSASGAHLVTGGIGADSLTGTAGADLMLGLAGDDTLRGLAGSDRIDGGAGRDTAVFSGLRAGYTVNVGVLATTVSGADGQDQLVGVERLQFDNLRVALDLDGNAGIAARTLGAVFGPAAVGIPAYAGIALKLVDEGMSWEQLMQLALNARLGAAAAHADVVKLLYTNVVGVAPDGATLALFTGMLDNRSLTPGQLGVAAADTGMNALRIDLVGLALSGLDYA